MSDHITPILMPKWGLSMKEGKLAAWHVQEGAEIKAGDDIMDVETDKIANVVEAADGGLLRRRVGQEGETYPVRMLLGVMAPNSVSDQEIEAYVAAYEMPEIEEDDEDEGPAYAFIDLPAGRVRYVHRENDGVPVILIHGFGGDLDNWLFNIDALAEKAPVYALDLPGHGQSVKSVADPDLDLLISSVTSLLAALEIDKAHLVGHSMGGLVAAKVALTNPSLVASLSLICPAGLGPNINADYIDGFVNAASRKELKPILLHLFHDPNLVSRAMVNDLLKYKRIDGVQAFLEGLSRALFANGEQAAQIGADMGKLDCPVQVIWGQSDAVIPDKSRQNIAGAQTHTISEAGHMVQMEQAAKVNELLVAFL